MCICINKDNSSIDNQSALVTMDPAANLTPEGVIEIFSHLDLIDLAKCCRLVSKRWTQLMLKDSNWMFLLTKLGISCNDAADYAKAKEHLGKNEIVVTVEQISAKLEKFVDTLLPTQKGEFNVSMPFNPGCYVNVKLLNGRAEDEGSDCKKTITLFQEIQSRYNGSHEFAIGSGSSRGYKFRIAIPIFSDVFCAIQNPIMKILDAYNEKLAGA
jgi:F-box-like